MKQYPRIKDLLAQFDPHRLDAYLITKDANIRYLTEFSASESWLLVTAKKTFYITDFRYILEAEEGLPGISIERYTKSFFETLFKVAVKQKVRRLGFDDRHISHAVFKKLKKECPKTIQLAAVNQLVENLREIKSAKEILEIRKALSLHQKALDVVKGLVRPGISEKKVCAGLESFVKSKDVGFSFSPIIASGPNSCFPHARVTERKIKNNEPVLIDMGIDVNGYKSDLTRMVFLGRIPRLVRKINDHVRRAQQVAIQRIKPGVPAAEVDRTARNYLIKKKLGQYFGHSLGHGVGLEIHEGPSISSKSPSIIKEGMIFTVEPAVYLPHEFGIRLEEMVLVTRQGCEVLSANID